MTRFFLPLLLLAAQAQALTLEKQAGSSITPEAEQAILSYVEINCRQVSALKENSTAVYGDSSPRIQTSYQLAAYIDFDFTGRPDFDRVEVLIDETKIGSLWTAKVVGFSGQFELCQNL